VTIRPRRILVLYWHEDPRHIHSAIRGHLRMLDHAAGKHEVFYCNTFKGAPSWLRRVGFDAVVLHTTFLCMRWHTRFSLWRWDLRWLNGLDAVKIAFPQDEYDHSEVLDEWLYELGVTEIFTNFDANYRAALYPLMSTRARFHKCLTGYVDDELAARFRDRLTDDRPLDVVYRARQLPYWFGSHGQLKHRIAGEVRGRATARGLQTDISTRLEDTIVGERWLDFLGSARAVTGCESGSSVLDRRGEVRYRIEDMMRHEPHLTFEAVSARMPSGWDDWAFFAVGPRHLEAAMTKTCQILVEGSYDGVLEAGRHYIPLDASRSNIDEALDRLADSHLVSRMVDDAHRDIVASGAYSYSTIARQLERVIVDESPSRRRLFSMPYPIYNAISLPRSRTSQP
jgi:hypothetical protein